MHFALSGCFYSTKVFSLSLYFAFLFDILAEFNGDSACWERVSDACFRKLGEAEIDLNCCWLNFDSSESRLFQFLIQILIIAASCILAYHGQYECFVKYNLLHLVVPIWESLYFLWLYVFVLLWKHDENSSKWRALVIHFKEPVLEDKRSWPIVTIFFFFEIYRNFFVKNKKKLNILITSQFGLETNGHSGNLGNLQMVTIRADGD